MASDDELPEPSGDIGAMADWLIELALLDDDEHDPPPARRLQGPPPTRRADTNLLAAAFLPPAESPLHTELRPGAADRPGYFELVQPTVLAADPPALRAAELPDPPWAAAGLRFCSRPAWRAALAPTELPADGAVAAGVAT